jgi:hypothetical protein
LAVAAAVRCHDGGGGGGTSDRCAPSSAGPDAETPSAGLGIRNGSDVAEGAYASVGMLYSTDDRPEVLQRVGLTRLICSATLLCPNVALTAAHCFAGDVAVGTYTLHLAAAPGETPPDREAAPHAKRVRYLSADGAAGAKDFALVQLDRDVSAKPVRIVTAALPDPTAGGGAAVTVVGYGQGGGKTPAGVKRSGAMRYRGAVDAPDNPLVHGMAMLEAAEGLDADPAKSASACAGDSGGAAVVDGRLYGVVARVVQLVDGKLQDRPTCDATNITLVAPIPRELAWIRQNVTELCSDGAQALNATVDGRAADEPAADAPCAAATASPSASPVTND